jgi:hypothetical protein
MVIGYLLVFWLFAVPWLPVSKQAINQPRDAQQPQPIEFSLHLDKSEVTPGETVRLEEIIPVEKKVRIRSISHDALRIGEYNPQIACLVNLPTRPFRFVNPSEEFSHLPGSVTASHARVPDLLTCTTRGRVFQFQPKCLGIYLLTVSWSLEGHENWISSTPIVLLVKGTPDESDISRLGRAG